MVKLSEHQLQTQIIKWARAQHGKWCNIFAIPNGGARNRIVGAKLKREGVQRGVPDLCLMLPAGRIVWIEVKLPGQNLSRHQQSWHLAAAHTGHEAHVVRSLGEAQEVVNTAVGRAKEATRPLRLPGYEVIPA